MDKTALKLSTVALGALALGGLMLAASAALAGQPIPATCQAHVMGISNGSKYFSTLSLSAKSIEQGREAIDGMLPGQSKGVIQCQQGARVEHSEFFGDERVGVISNSAAMRSDRGLQQNSQGALKYRLAPSK